MTYTKKCIYTDVVLTICGVCLHSLHKLGAASAAPRLFLHPLSTLKGTTNLWTGGGARVASKYSRLRPRRRGKFENNILFEVCSRQHRHMSFCGPCQAVSDENPIAMLIRRDADGNNLLCAQCRVLVYRTHERVNAGAMAFTFANPAVDATPVAELHRAEEKPKPVQEWGGRAEGSVWHCKLCACVIAAKQRAFEGGEEPEDWWWCRACQQTHREKHLQERDQRKQEQVKKLAVLTKKKRQNDRDSRQSHGTQKLDKWLTAHAHV